jgi:hypothetical protein
MKITPDPRTRLRLRTTGLAALDYGLNVLILCGFAAAGSVPYEVPLRSLAAAVPFNLMFLGGISSGLTQRFRDPSITGIQVFAACGINLLGLLLAPQIAYMFIVNLFVPLSFGGLHFSRRQFFVAWLLASVSLGATLWIVRPRVGIALSSPAEQFLLWAVLTFAFGRFLAINAEVSRLRVRLQDKNRDLAEATTRLSELATRDELTGAWNRREFMRMLEDQRKHAERSGVGFCLDDGRRPVQGGERPFRSSAGRRGTPRLGGAACRRAAGRRSARPLRRRGVRAAPRRSVGRSRVKRARAHATLGRRVRLGSARGGNARDHLCVSPA